MQPQKTSSRQAVSLIFLYMAGSAFVLSPGRQAGRDIWIAIIITLVMSVALALLYGRLIQLYPDKNFCDMQLTVFGPVLGRISMLVFVWFTFHLGALVIRDFTEYIQIVSFGYIPQYIFALPLVLLSIWVIRSGIGTLPRWAAFVFPIFLTATLAIVLLSIQNWKVDNMLPILDDGFAPVLDGAKNLLAFPFMETVYLLFILKPLVKTKKAVGVYILGFVLLAATLMIISMRNVAIIGHQNVEDFYFPSYQTVSLIDIGDFIQGIQATLVMTFILGGFVKIASLLFAACQGVSSLLKLKDYRALAAPVGLLMLTFSLFVVSDIIDITNSIQQYKYYILPAGLLLPALLWIVAECKTHKMKKRQSMPEQESLRADG